MSAEVGARLRALQVELRGVCPVSRAALNARVSTTGYGRDGGGAAVPGE